MPKGDYPATGVIQIVRGGGAVTLRYVGVPAVSEEAEDEIQKAIDQFLDDCQTMIVWYAGIERLQDIIHQRLSETVPRDCWQPAKVAHFESREIRGFMEVL